MALSSEEQVLLEGCRRCDEQAWLQLYRTYAGDIGRFLKGMLHPSAEIDDLVQKVFLEFLSSLERFRGDAGLRTWLHRIARHVGLHDLRSQTRRSQHVRAYAETIEIATPGLEPQIVARDRLAQVMRLLGELDQTFREVWLLREIQGFGVAETAHVLEVPEATVRTRHHRARQRLLKLVEELDLRDAEHLANPPQRLQLIHSQGGDA